MINRMYLTATNPPADDTYSKHDDIRCHSPLVVIVVVNAVVLSVAKYSNDSQLNPISAIDCYYYMASKVRASYIRFYLYFQSVADISHFSLLLFRQASACNHLN